MSGPLAPQPSKPPEGLVEDYRHIAANGGDLQMLKTLKIVRSIIVNLGIISIALAGLLQTGADPTMVSVLGIVTLGLFNGVEVVDYFALMQAFAEVRGNAGPDDDAQD